MRLRSVAAICMAVAVPALSAPAATGAQADQPGVSDVYAFDAQITVTSVFPSNLHTDAWWSGGDTSYSMFFNLCAESYSAPEVTVPENPPCAILTTTFRIPAALVCGSGLGGSMSALTIDEEGSVPGTTTVSSYSVALADGAGEFEGTGTESDGGTVTVSAAFSVVPWQPSPPDTSGNRGACTGQFLAAGTITVVETA